MAISKTDQPLLRAPVFTRIKKEEIAKLTPRQAEIYQARLETDPPRSISQLCERFGVTRTAVNGAWNQITKRLGYNPVGDLVSSGRRPGNEKQALLDLKALAPTTMADHMQRTVKLLVDHMTPQKMREARVDQLAKSVADLVKSRNLLIGEPTQILRVEERQHMNDLLPALLREARSRGFKLEGGQVRREMPAPKVIDAEAPRGGR